MKRNLLIAVVVAALVAGGVLFFRSRDTALEEATVDVTVEIAPVEAPVEVPEVPAPVED